MSLAILIAVSMLDLWAPNEFRYMRCEHNREMRATNGNGPPHGPHLRRAASPVITERGARPQGLTPSIMASQVMDSQASTVPGLSLVPRLSLDVVVPPAAVPQWGQEIQAPGCTTSRDVAIGMPQDACDIGVQQLLAVIPEDEPMESSASTSQSLGGTRSRSHGRLAEALHGARPEAMVPEQALVPVREVRQPAFVGSGQTVPIEVWDFTCKLQTDLCESRVGLVRAEG